MELPARTLEWGKGPSPGDLPQTEASFHCRQISLSEPPRKPRLPQGKTGGLKAAALEKGPAGLGCEVKDKRWGAVGLRSRSLWLTGE